MKGNTQQYWDESVLESYILDGTRVDIVNRYKSLKALAEASDFGEYDENIVVLDTETTGISYNHDELTQIAAARMNHGEIVDWYITFVNPQKPIPDDVAHLTDIHDEDVVDAPCAPDALKKLVEFIGDAKIVAHNVDFDRNFTTRHPEGYPLLENEWIDSLDLSRIALPRMKSHRLIDLVSAFGAPRSTHRADDDVAATCALFRILLAAVSVMPQPLVQAIASMSTRDIWCSVTVFQFFDKRNKEAAANQNQTIEPFSLKKLRQEFVKSLNNTTRKASRVTYSDQIEEEKPLHHYPSQDEVSAAFSQEGILGKIYENYEAREEQVIMANTIRDCFEKQVNLTVEAGTGVGKSMAYLVPSALTALKNNIAVGIATKTNALLDQLIYQELPALTEILKQNEGETLTYSSLKGFSHYPCLRKIERLVNEGPGLREVNRELVPQAPALASLLSYIEQSEYDDIDYLKLDYRALPRWAITTTSNDCLRRKCPYFGKSCFVHGSRRRAEQSHIVVTNHSLLFCDLAADGSLLPSIDYWVIDEAHSAEQEARRAFTISIATDDLARLVRRVSADHTTQNVFLKAERNIVINGEGDSTTLFYALTSKAKAAGLAFAQSAEEFSATIDGLLFFDNNKHSKSYDYVDIWINDDVRSSYTFAAIVEYGSMMAEKAEKLIAVCQELVGYLEGIDDAAAIQREIAATVIELKNTLKAVEVILLKGDETYVYAANICKRKGKGAHRLEAMPFNVGSILDETLYTHTRSVVFSSATLTTGGSFEPFEEAMGLNQSESSECVTLELPSSYDFDKNMSIFVVQDMPEPNQRGYINKLQELLLRTHKAQRGSMLTLFTNRREMETCFTPVQSALKEDDLRLVCQKWGLSTKGLRDDFLADEHLSLFALKSFWEGFDAPGATLKGVIIPKLPFQRPSDPLSLERELRDAQAWKKYSLPVAILETKQAAGRLIRKADDHGVLILADKRLLTKWYGKIFLASMPSHNVHTVTLNELVEHIEAHTDTWEGMC